MARGGLSARRRACFLEVLAETGNVSQAARQSGLNRQHLYVTRREDEDFSLAWEQALDEAADALLAEARRRAVEGVEQPVYHAGELVGTRRVYSDRLLVFLLQAHGLGPDRTARRTVHPARVQDEPLPRAAAVAMEPAATAPAAAEVPERWRTDDGVPIEYEEISCFDPEEKREVVVGTRATLPLRLRASWEAEVRKFLALLDGHRARGQSSDWARPDWPDPPRVGLHLTGPAADAPSLRTTMQGAPGPGGPAPARPVSSQVLSGCA